VIYHPHTPKLVVTHGAGGQAEWHCRHWDKILSSQATLICPQGKRRFRSDPTRGYYFADHLQLEQEVLSAIAHFEEHFEARAPDEKYLYVGYSQGATMGALAFASHGELFPYLLLIEGGFADFSRPLASRFKASGGLGALFVCGTKQCRDKSQQAARSFASLGLWVDVRYAPFAGHRPDGPVTRALVQGLPALLKQVPRWSDLAPIAPDDLLDGNG
jgi:predicted esterase